MCNTNMRAAIYTRAARPNSSALPVQLDECRRFCEEKGYEVVEALVIGEGATPMLRACKGLTRILDAAQRHEFDVLVHADQIDLRMLKYQDYRRVHQALERSGVQQVNLYQVVSRG